MAAFSHYNSQLTLETVCARPEGQYLERKSCSIRPTKLANEIIGMLNASGGVIALGIGDDGNAEDLSLLDEEALNHFRKVVNDLIHPPANVTLEELALPGGELIFLYHVEQDYERLFQRPDNEDVYLRVADSNKGPLSRDEVKKLEYNRSIRSFENELRPDFDPIDFSPATCENYRVTKRYEGRFEELLRTRSLGLVQDGKFIYRNAAILLFAKDPSQYIPSALVRYVRYDGIEKLAGRNFNVIKDERLEGNIPDLIKTLEVYIEATLRDYYFFDLEAGKFRKIPEYPKDAWLEGIVNALCHRSYNLQGNTIYLNHFDDRLEISNSGPLPAQVTVENIRSERYARNPGIARVLSELGYVRELNEGVRRIYDAMHDSLLSEPIYTNQHNTVTLTLRNKVSDSKETIHGAIIERIEESWPNLNRSQQELVSWFLEEKEATISALVDQLSIGAQAIRYNLKKLEELKILERISDKIRDPGAIYRFCQE